MQLTPSGNRSLGYLPTHVWRQEEPPKPGQRPPIALGLWVRNCCGEDGSWLWDQWCQSEELNRGLEGNRGRSQIRRGITLPICISAMAHGGWKFNPFRESNWPNQESDCEILSSQELLIFMTSRLFCWKSQSSSIQHTPVYVKHLRQWFLDAQCSPAWYFRTRVKFCTRRSVGVATTDLIKCCLSGTTNTGLLKIRGTKRPRFSA